MNTESSDIEPAALFELPPIDETESASVLYGRALQSADNAGLSAQHCLATTRYLLKSGQWRESGHGFASVSEFIKTIPFSKYAPTSEMVSEFEELAAEHGATQRAIGKATDQDHSTVGRHLNKDSGANAPKSDDYGDVQAPDQPKHNELFDDGDGSGAFAPSDQTVELPESSHEDDKPSRNEDDADEPDEPEVNKKDEWYTPKWLFDSLDLRFDLDVCAPLDRTHSSVPAEQFFTIEDDGLSQRWHGLVWCNPPYSKAAGWANRMILHGNGLLLTHVPMNALWCMEVWDACDGVRLFQGIDFVRPDGETQRPAWWLQLAAFGDEAVQALQQLEPFGDAAHNKRRMASPMLRPVL